MTKHENAVMYYSRQLKSLHTLPIKEFAIANSLQSLPSPLRSNQS
jgi:hypothetical protein